MLDWALSDLIFLLQLFVAPAIEESWLLTADEVVALASILDLAALARFRLHLERHRETALHCLSKGH